MKNQFQFQEPQANHLAGLIVLVFGIILSSGMYLLAYFQIVNVDFEIILAPLIVISALAFGETLIIFFILNPLQLFLKLTKRFKDFS